MVYREKRREAVVKERLSSQDAEYRQHHQQQHHHYHQQHHQYHHHHHQIMLHMLIAYGVDRRNLLFAFIDNVKPVPKVDKKKVSRTHMSRVNRY